MIHDVGCLKLFSTNSNGNASVLDWLRKLPASDRKAMGLDLLRVQENWPIGMPVCKSLGGGLWEVRTSLAGGRIARLLFCMRGNTIFVVNGFYKTTQRTPAAELDLARKRMKDVMK